MKFSCANLLVAPLLAVAGRFATVAADKDSNYYRPGFVNPNIEREMYWQDSVNVLQDLDQFSSLYVKYEGCVWSKWGSRYESYDDHEGGGGGGEDGATTEKGCGTEGEGDEYWYTGRTQCFRANASFTLYGVLKSNPKTENGGGMCHKGTYINSFFTTFGVEAFSGPLGLDTTYANSYCSTQAPNDDANMYYEVYDDERGEYHDYKNYAAYTSYGTSCQKSKFVITSYQGAFCDTSDGYLDTTDNLESFNEAIESLGCVEIYNADNYNNGEGHRLGEDDAYQLDFEEDVGTVEILKFSRACSIHQYPHQCPDPYGFLKKYNKAMTRALNGAPVSWKSSSEKWMNALSALFLVGAAALAYFAFRTKRRIAQKPNVERKQPAPAPSQKVTQSPSTVSCASSAMAGSVISVKEAIEQVFVPRAPSTISVQKSRTSSWDWNKKPKNRVMEMVGMDNSIASSKARDDSEQASIGSVEIIENAQATPEKGTPKKDEEAVLSRDGHSEKKSSSKKKKGLFGRFGRSSREI